MLSFFLTPENFMTNGFKALQYSSFVTVAVFITPVIGLLFFLLKKKMANKEEPEIIPLISEKENLDERDHVPMSPELLSYQTLHEEIVNVITKHFSELDDCDDSSNPQEYLNKLFQSDNWMTTLRFMLATFKEEDLSSKLKSEFHKKKSSQIIFTCNIDKLQFGDNNQIIQSSELNSNPSSSNEEEVVKEDLTTEFEETDTLDVFSKDDSETEADSIQESEITTCLSATGKKEDINMVKKAKKLDSRKYQNELAEKAINGFNVIICAPTNSGKTVVATIIIMNHFKICVEKKNQPKVIFIVPKKILLGQQTLVFTQYLASWRIRKRGGSSYADYEKVKKRPIKDLFNESDMIVMTADILKNALKAGDINIADITLLLFDECHHAISKHPYMEIMFIYLKDKAERPEGNRPQIVGLTASPPTNGKIKFEDIKNKIWEFCSNLDANEIVTVVENIPELKICCSDQQKIVKSLQHRKANQFQKCIVNMMNRIENKISFSPLPSRETPQYNSVLAEEIKSAVQEMNISKLKCLKMLKSYHEALRCHEIFEIRHALKVLQKAHTNLEGKNPKPKTAEAWLLKIFKETEEKLEEYKKLEAEHPNPYIKELKEFLIDESNGEEFKAFIFVRTKHDTKAMKEILDDDEHLCKLTPEIMVGSTEDGMNENKKEDLLKRFKDAKKKIIICTSVMEEGIDVPDCNMTIKYNYLTSEIASYQISGRVRTKMGKNVVFGSEQNAIKEKNNSEVEKLVNSAIVYIRNMGIAERLEKIKGLQEKAISDRNSEEESKKIRYGQDDPENVKFLCPGCQPAQFICKATDITMFKNNYLIDPAVIDKKVDYKAKKDSKHVDRTIIECIKCGQHLGTKRGDDICLGIKHFIIDINGTKKQIKNWDSRTFYIKEKSI